ITASQLAGTVGTSPLTITFTPNGNTNALAPNIFTATATFTNTSNGQGTTSRVVQVAVNPVAEPVCDVSTPLGDVGGDGKSDIVWRRNDGAIALWQMSGTSANATALGTVGTDWSIAGLGDVDGNGRADIIWRNVNGAVAIWIMNGSTVQQAVGLGTVGTEWTIAAVRDFDGDGKADILWRSDNGGGAGWCADGHPAET